MSKLIILLALLGLSISKIMVLDNVQDLRELMKDTENRQLSNDYGIGIGNITAMRHLEMSKKHEMKAETQHKNLGITRYVLCYKRNGTYKILTLVISSDVDMKYKAERGCFKLVAL